MVATEPRLAIVWDEGYTLGREARVRAWLRAMADPRRFAASWRPALELLVQDPTPPPPASALDTRAALLSRRVLDWFWPFAREEPHGHPPFYALIGLIGDVVVPSWLPLPRARLGPMLVFSLTAGAIFASLVRRWGIWPAITAVGAWIFQPRLFGDAHYAAYDGLLTSLWVLAILAFARAVEPRDGPASRRPRWGWAIAFGLAVGAAAATKFTGWFLPLPFLAWVLWSRDRRGAWVLAAGGALAIGVLYASNPAWWFDPVAGVERFLRSNLSRGRTIPIPVLFLGRVVRTPNESLPWYNTLAWTVFVTPVGFLFLALVGGYRAIRRRTSEPFGLLVLVHWLFLLALRSLPHTPGHDGVRLFLPAFGCLALLAGLGAGLVIERFGRLGRILVAAALVEGAVSVALMMPLPLSYYSPAVGGLRGAAALGMEPTYAWDALDDEALAWLNRHTPPGGKVAFATNPSSWLYLRLVGRLRPATQPAEPGEYVWYVLQNRPGGFSPLDRALLARGTRCYRGTRAGVPLIVVFPFSEVRAWYRSQGFQEGRR